VREETESDGRIVEQRLAGTDVERRSSEAEQGLSADADVERGTETEPPGAADLCGGGGQVLERGSTPRSLPTRRRGTMAPCRETVGMSWGSP
jgi:hypothetical protein